MNQASSPLVRLSIPFIGGMLVANLFVSTFVSNFKLLIPALLLLLLFIIIFHLRRQFLAFSIGLFLFMFTLGATLFSIKYNHQQQLTPTEGTELTGRIISQTEKKAKTYAFRLKTESGATIIAYTKKAPPYPATCTLLSPRITPTSPILLTDTAFIDYRKYLFFTGICATAYSRDIICHPDTEKVHHLLPQNSEISSIYQSRGITGDEGAVIEAMTTGNKQLLTNEIRQHYSKAGASHILALSGYHLTLIYTLLELLLFGKIIHLRWRWTVNIIILATLWIFASITGYPPSLVRATIMCSILILSKIFYQDNLSLNSLAIAAFVMLIINPLQLFDVGFQLSFASMTGILLVGVPLLRHIDDRYQERPIWHYGKSIFSIIIITTVCSIFTAPLVAYYFHQLPLLSILTNLIITILAPIIIGGSMIWWALAIIPSVQALITPLLLKTAGLMNNLTEAISSLSYSTAEWHPNIIGVILFYVLIFNIIIFFVNINVKKT